jgi:hypothetical protein
MNVQEIGCRDWRWKLVQRLCNDERSGNIQGLEVETGSRIM